MAKPKPASGQALSPADGTRVPSVIQRFLKQAELPIDPTQFVAIDDLDVLAHRFQAADRMSLTLTLWRGANLKALMDSRPADVADFLKTIGMPRSTAYNYLAVFDALGQLSSVEKVQSTGLLNFSKLVEVCRWEPAEIEALTAGEEVRGITIEQAAELTDREFKAREKEWAERALQADERIQKLEREAHQKQTRIDTLEAEKLRLARERSRVLAEEDLPPFALEARQESIALTDTMGFALDNLQSVIETNLLADNKHPEALRWQPIAAGTAWHAMAAVHARIGLLMKRLNAHFGDEVTGTHLAHSLSPAEVALATAGRAGLLAAHQAEVKRRDDKRENDRPGKPGRKRG